MKAVELDDETYVNFMGKEFEFNPNHYFLTFSARLTGRD